MRTKRLFALSSLIFFSLSSCQKKENTPIPTGSTITPTPTPVTPTPTPSGGTITPPVTHDPASDKLLITEINTGTTIANRAVEISNIGDEDINLLGYTIEVYRSYSNISTESIPLAGVISAHSSYVIAYSGASIDIRNKAQLVTADYLNDGTFPVSLNYYEEVIDCVGMIGFNYDFAKNAVLVRKQEYFVQSQTFDDYKWVRYPTNSIYTLGNYDCVSDEILSKGPKLSQEDFLKPFCTSADNGTGGVIKVTLSWTSDGDTTGFNYGYDYSEFDVYGSLSTRYYGVNTPEIAHSAGEVSDPYGDEAKEFTNAILRSSRSFLVQSVNGYNIHETYGRMLGYVWVSDKSNPNPEDYQLLNFLIVRNGFSHPAFLNRSADYNSLMTYQGVSFVEYLFDAENYAAYNKLNIHSGGN